jgi:hypothetical protein
VPSPFFIPLIDKSSSLLQNRGWGEVCPLPLSRIEGAIAMKRQMVCNLSMDVVTSKSRVSSLTEIVEQIVTEGDKLPKFYLGNAWYHNMLVVSTEVDDKDIDKLLRACSNAWHIAEDTSDDFSTPFILHNNDEEGYCINHNYQHELEDTDQLHSVSFNDGEVTFVLADDTDTEWLVIEI